MWDGLDFLRRVNSGETPALGPNVLVIGGGDVAMDAARCARRLPGVTSVHLACLESRAEMPAHSWEAAEALEEGVVFHNSLGPTEHRDRRRQGDRRGLPRLHQRVRRDRDGSPRGSTTPRPSILAADTVIVTIGQGIDAAGLGVATGPGGRIVADSDTLATSVPGVFAGGDAVLGPASMVDAMAQGHQAAEAIDAYLRGRQAGPDRPGRRRRRGTRRAPNRPEPDARRAQQDRVKMPQADPAGRVGDFTEIDLGYSAEQAIAEAERCLACGLCSECMQCVKACSAGAVLHDQQPDEIEIDAGSVILTPGFEEFQALAARRVRPRALRQRALQRAVRADALGRRPHRRARAAALRRRRGQSASPSSSAWAAATPPAATATARPSAA